MIILGELIHEEKGKPLIHVGDVVEFSGGSVVVGYAPKVSKGAEKVGFFENRKDLADAFPVAEGYRIRWGRRVSAPNVERKARAI